MKTLNDIALTMTGPRPGRGYYRCVVDVARLADAWSRHRHYFDASTDPAPHKAARFKAYLDSGATVEAPIMLFVGETDSVCAMFLDGRHRFRAMLDSGVDRCVVYTRGMKSVDFGVEAGIVLEHNAPPHPILSKPRSHYHVKPKVRPHETKPLRQILRERLLDRLTRMRSADPRTTDRPPPAAG